MVGRLAVQARPRLVAPAQGEAGQVVGEAVVGVGLGEAGANDSVLGPSAAVYVAAIDVFESCSWLEFSVLCPKKWLPDRPGVVDVRCCLDIDVVFKD